MARIPGITIVMAGLAVATSRAEPPAFVPGEVVVRFRDSASPLEQERALARISSRTRGRFLRPRSDPRRTTVVRATTPLAVEDAVRRLAADPAVAWAEPNFTCRAAGLPDDPAYLDGRLWGAYSDDMPAAVGPPGTTASMGMQAEKAWTAGNVGDRSVVVAIIDEGVAVDHPDLASNAWTNPFDPENGLDDDGNGFVDDVHGWDFLDGDASVYDGGSTGGIDRHGTHVAGTIGAAGDNALGGTGACWEVTLLPLKILGPSGGTTLDATHALDYLVDLKRRHGLNVVAANCSWTSAGYSRGLHEAAIRAAREGILITCAAGNDGVDTDAQPTWPATLDTTVGTLMERPAAYDAIIAVAAIERTGGLASYSNRGATSVDLGAPGSLVYSTLPPSGFGYMSGTSMAAPHVAGAVALWAASHPGALAPEIREAILDSVQPTPSLSGVTATGGRLDVARFVAPFADVRISAVAAPALLMKGLVANVTVTVTNEGEKAAQVRVSLADEPAPGGIAGIVGEDEFVNLAPGEARTVTLRWRTATASAGRHELRASVAPLAGETDLADNEALAGVTLHAVPQPRL